jgi:hypothetical protein
MKHDGVFFGIFFFSFSAIYQVEEKATDSKEKHVERHGENEHKNMVEGDGIHP